MVAQRFRCKRTHLDVDVVVNNYLRDNVSKVINMGCCLETSIIGKNLAEKYDSVYFAAGFHPGDINAFNDGLLEYINNFLTKEVFQDTLFGKWHIEEILKLH